MSNKVVYNACYGGFSLSKEAIFLARQISGNERWGECLMPGEIYEDGSKCSCFYGYIGGIERHDPVLVSVVEQLGDLASGRAAKLRIAYVGNQYRIDEYDGFESVQQPDEIDWVVIK